MGLRTEVNAAPRVEFHIEHRRPDDLRLYKLRLEFLRFGRRLQLLFTLQPHAHQIVQLLVLPEFGPRLDVRKVWRASVDGCSLATVSGAAMLLQR